MTKNKTMIKFKVFVFYTVSIIRVFVVLYSDDKKNENKIKYKKTRKVAAAAARHSGISQGEGKINPVIRSFVFASAGLAMPPKQRTCAAASYSIQDDSAFATISTAIHDVSRRSVGRPHTV